MAESDPVVLRFSAFTTADGGPGSGNPAGVVFGADELSDEKMLGIAAELGFSETAFLSEVRGVSGDAGRSGDTGHFGETGVSEDVWRSGEAALTGDGAGARDGEVAARIRYFTPRAEIAFCGHATIASGVALARRGAGPVVSLTTNAGVVPVEVSPGRATLIAVETTVEALADDVLDELLRALGLARTDLDPALPPAFVRGGNPHPLIFVGDGVLARLDHDGAAVLAIQDRYGWDGTVPVVHRVSETEFASRNPFPRGGIREDPATGSAAASLGEYLRAGGHLIAPAEIVVAQGAETGRPSSIAVSIPATGRIRVTGTAEELATEGLAGPE